MANISRTYTFVNGQPADGTQVNKNFDDLLVGINATAAYSEGTWTPVLAGATVVGTAPTLAGTYRRIGNLVFITCVINAGAGGNTSVATIGGATTTIATIPIAISASPGFSTCTITNGSEDNLGIGAIRDTHIYPPTITAQIVPIYITATYNA